MNTSRRVVDAEKTTQRYSPRKSSYISAA